MLATEGKRASAEISYMVKFLKYVILSSLFRLEEKKKIQEKKKTESNFDILKKLFIW